MNEHAPAALLEATIPSKSSTNPSQPYVRQHTLRTRAELAGGQQYLLV